MPESGIVAIAMYKNTRFPVFFMDSKNFLVALREKSGPSIGTVNLYQSGIEVTVQGPCQQLAERSGTTRRLARES